MNCSEDRSAGRGCGGIGAEERLLLNFYCAELLAEGPGTLSLRKVWAPFNPHWRDRSTRGYYVTFTHRGRLRYRRFGLTELRTARTCYEALADAMRRRLG